MVREGGRQPESKTVVFSVLHSESVLTEEPTAQVRCCPSFSIALSPIACRRSCRDSTRTLVCSRLLCKQKGRNLFGKCAVKPGQTSPAQSDIILLPRLRRRGSARWRSNVMSDCLYRHRFLPIRIDPSCFYFISLSR